MYRRNLLVVARPVRALAVGGGGVRGASSLGLAVGRALAAAVVVAGGGGTVVATLLAGGKNRTHCRWLCPPGKILGALWMLWMLWILLKVLLIWFDRILLKVLLIWFESTQKLKQSVCKKWFTR